MNPRLGHAIAHMCEAVALRAACAAMAFRPLSPTVPAFEPPVDVDPVRTAREHLLRCRRAAAAAAAHGDALDKLVADYCVDMAEDSLHDAEGSEHDSRRRDR